jgi:hypothetical protein
MEMLERHVGIMDAVVKNVHKYQQIPNLVARDGLGRY